MINDLSHSSKVRAVREGRRSTVSGYIRYSIFATTKLSKITWYCHLHQLEIYVRQVRRFSLKYIDNIIEFEQNRMRQCILSTVFFLNNASIPTMTRMYEIRLKLERTLWSCDIDKTDMMRFTEIWFYLEKC